MQKKINLWPWPVIYFKEKNNIGHNFWTISDRPLIFGM